MSFTFRPAKRENVQLIIGIAGPSGSGKTYSAMRVAAGICGDKPFALIDTENGRGKHYADKFRFDHGDLRAPFRPDAYGEAIIAADKGGYGAIVVDSMSHEWAGDGGILDWQEEELQAMGGGDNQKMRSWIKPKMSHKRFVAQTLLTVRAHLILCFRAEEKLSMEKDDKGKMQIVKRASPVGLDGWVPICEKNLPYECSVSFLLSADKPGIPLPIKLQEQHRPMFPAGKLLDEEAGKRIAEWAHGGEASTKDETRKLTNPKVDSKQAQKLHIIAKGNGWVEDKFKAKLMERYKVTSTLDLTLDSFNDAAEFFKLNRMGAV